VKHVSEMIVRTGMNEFVAILIGRYEVKQTGTVSISRYQAVQTGGHTNW